VSKHRRTKARPSKPTQDFDPGILISLLYDDLVEVEAIAVTADECVTSLPPSPTGKHRRTLARLFTLVAKTSGRAQGALERVEELVVLHDAHLAAIRAAKRSPARRAR
jgi:hypothetical protein